MAIQDHEVNEEQGVETVLLAVGESNVELLKPLGPETPVGKVIEKKDTGLHHVADAVADIDAELERVKALGLRVMDETPSNGIRGSGISGIGPGWPRMTSPWKAKMMTSVAGGAPIETGLGRARNTPSNHAAPRVFRSAARERAPAASGMTM